jgi:hypothetical protein
MPAIKQGMVDRELASEGDHAAVIMEWFNWGVSEGSKYKKHQGLFVVWLDEKIKEGENAGKRKELWAWHSLSANKRAKMRIWLQKLRGAVYTDQEIKDGKCDPELPVMHSRVCTVHVEHETKDDGMVRDKVKGFRAIDPAKIPDEFKPLIEAPAESESSIADGKLKKHGGGTWVVHPDYKPVMQRKEQDTSFDPSTFGGGTDDGDGEDDDAPAVVAAAPTGKALF